MTGHTMVLLLAWATGAGALCTTLVRRLAILTGFVARPNPLVPQHTQTVAYMGGVGIALAFALGYAAWPFLAGGMPTRELALLWPALAFTLLGVVDDLLELRPLVKLGWQILLAGCAVAVGVHAAPGAPGIVSALLAMVWIVTLVNAVNLTDVCDGLVGGLAVIGFVTTALLEPSLAMPALLAAGACLGFLLLNAPPARIFMGDAGSHLLGFLFAAMALIMVRQQGAQSIPAALLITGVFLFELALLIVIRRRKGIPWWRGSPDHFSLRLQAAGCNRWQTDLIAWTVAALLALFALSWTRLSGAMQWVGMTIVVTGMLAAGCWLRQHEVNPD
jgi:UDP-GlcNAc:undecaprenyl-phosphate GlcNAc-1-phosphate transferase